MQDFAAELRAAREPLSYGAQVEVGESRGDFEGYLVSQAVRRGFDLGYEAGDKAAGARFRVQIELVREQSRLAGFDTGVSVLLMHTLLGLQEVVGELESRRTPKVMLEKARARLGELVVQLEGVAAVMPAVHPEQLGMDWPGQEAS